MEQIIWVQMDTLTFTPDDADWVNTNDHVCTILYLYQIILMIRMRRLPLRCLTVPNGNATVSNTADMATVTIDETPIPELTIASSAANDRGY